MTAWLVETESGAKYIVDFGAKLWRHDDDLEEALMVFKSIPHQDSISRDQIAELPRDDEPRLGCHMFFQNFNGWRISTPVKWSKRIYRFDPATTDTRENATGKMGWMGSYPSTSCAHCGGCYFQWNGDWNLGYACLACKRTWSERDAAPSA